MEKTKKRVKLKTILKIAPILLIVISSIIYAFVDYIIDFLWFKELGYVSVFFTKLTSQLKIGIPIFIVVTFLSYIYFKLIKKNYDEKIATDISTANQGKGNKTVNKISWLFGMIVGGVVTFYIAGKLWFLALQFFNSTKFGYKDPIFKMDISFYIFKLDFIKSLNSLIILMLVISILLTVFYYAVLMGFRKPRVFKENAAKFDEEDPFNNNGDKEFSANGRWNVDFDKLGENLKKGIRGKGVGKTFDNENLKNILSLGSKQLIIAGILLFLNIAGMFFLKQFDLLASHNGAVYGAGYTDVKVTLLAYRIIIGLNLLGAILLPIAVKKHKMIYIFATPVLTILVLMLGGVLASVVQSTVVSPNEIAKESQYLEKNIEFTQKAYGLDKIAINDFAANNTLTAEDIKKNDPTISNIRINDYIPTEKFYNQTQSIRQYYTFNDVDVDRYNINGEYTQTFLSAREIDENKISNTWLNTHLKYTHGYGITLSRVDAVTASGQPSMLVKNIPPESSVEEIEIKRPEIYFGEAKYNYAIVGATEDEFDYPNGDSNKYTRYEGKAGIKLNLFNRILFAIQNKSFKLLVSSNIKSDSRIIINRNIVDRVEKLMPQLDYDKEPYMVISEGKLYWIIDAYTSSNSFPYSEPFKINGKRVNYVRNSIKVVIDAYNGDVDYYIVDENDPIASTFRKIYPKLFKTFSEMSEDLKKHIRYPSALFATQAKVYGKYHMNDVRVFYQKEDLWDIANEIYGTEEKAMVPSYYIMNLPGETTAEFVNTIPFTPKDKKNMTGIMIARNDGDNYGRLVLYKFPKNKLVYGPRQIEAQIDQDPEISKEFSLWNSSGSKYSRGNMFVVPIEESILYVEPVYLEASESSIPEVKRVIVAYGDKIAYENTFKEALDKIFGDGAGDLQGSRQIEESNNKDDKDKKELSQKDIIEKANSAYEKAIEHQRKGDWAKYGEYMNELESYLKKLK